MGHRPGVSPAPVTWPTWALPSPPFPQPHPPSRRQATALPGLQPWSNGRRAGHAEQAAAPGPRPRPVPGSRFPSRALPPLNATPGRRTAALATVIPSPPRPPRHPPPLPLPGPRPRQPGACARARVCARPARTRARRRVPGARCRNMAGSVADSDAVVVSAAAAREAGSSEDPGEGCGPAAPREARYLSAAGGWELGGPRHGAGGRRPGARRARVRARGLVGPQPRRPGFPPLETVPRRGLRREAERCRCTPATSPRTGPGQRLRERLC